MKWIILAGVIAAFSAASTNATSQINDKDWADCQLGRKNPPSAIRGCTIVLTRPTSSQAIRATAFYSRGVAYQQSEDLDRAISDLTASIGLSPNLAYRYQDRGETYAKKREFAKAISDFDQAIRLDGRYAFRYHARASAYRDLGNYERALLDFSKAIEIDRAHDFRFGDRGAVYMSLRRWREALADFDEVNRLNPGHAASHWKKAKIHLELGDRQRALDESSRAIELDPKDADAYFVRADVRLAMDDKIAARDDLESGLRLRPGDSPAIAALNQITSMLVTRPPIAQISPQVVIPPMANTSQKRVALVIGNSTYGKMGGLPNPARDAADVANLLRRAGFQIVDQKLNLGLSAFRRALADFEIASRDSDVAIIYFSGHGIAVGGQDYLLPIDAALQRDVDVQDEAVSLTRVLRATESARRLRLVILDACRDNPFAPTMQKVATRAVSRGLAPPAEAANTLIAFSAKAGTQATDGVAGGNSPFTAALLLRLAEPGVDVQMAFRRVRDDVLSATDRRQEPYTYGSLGGEELPLFPR